MDSTTRFSSNFSIPTTRISRRWSIRLSLSKIRSQRWRRMARGKCHSRTVFGKQHQASLTSVRAFLQKPEYGSSTNAWIASPILDAATELSGIASKLLDAEALARGSSTQCAATVSPEHKARPSPNCSNLAECTSSGKP
jgi:hypothetical protein